MREKKVINTIKNKVESIEPDSEWLERHAQLFESGLDKDVLSRLSNERSQIAKKHFFSPQFINILSYVVASVSILFLLVLTLTFASKDSTPGEPFYSVKKATETTELNYVKVFRNEVRQAEMYLQLADRRIEELDELTQQKTSSIFVSRVHASEQNTVLSESDQEKIEKLLKEYTFYLNKAYDLADIAHSKGLETDELFEKISQSTSRHQETLTAVSERVPEEAQKGINRALEVSRRNHEEEMENGKPEVTPGKPEETPGKPEVTPDKPEETPDKPEETPDKPKETPDKPEETPGKPEEKFNEDVDENDGKSEDLPEKSKDLLPIDEGRKNREL